MNDIVERLRAEATDNRRYEVNGTLAVEAADDIIALRAEVEDLGNRLHHVHRLWANNEHALRAENERLRAALREYECHCPTSVCEWFPCGKTARAALEEKS